MLKLKILHSRNSANDWLFQWKWVLWTLRQWVVSIIIVFVERHDLLQLREMFNMEQKKEDGWNSETVLRGEKLKCCRNVWIWMVETFQAWCVSEGTLERIIPIQASTASEPNIGPEKIGRIVWLNTVWHQHSKTTERTSCKNPAIIQNYKLMWTRYWTINSRVFSEPRVNVPTATKSRF